jgi:hypothetical protein
MRELTLLAIDDDPSSPSSPSPQAPERPLESSAGTNIEPLLSLSVVQPSAVTEHDGKADAARV